MTYLSGWLVMHFLIMTCFGYIFAALLSVTGPIPQFRISDEKRWDKIINLLENFLKGSFCKENFTNLITFTNFEKIIRKKSQILNLKNYFKYYFPAHVLVYLLVMIPSLPSSLNVEIRSD